MSAAVVALVSTMAQAGESCISPGTTSDLHLAQLKRRLTRVRLPPDDAGDITSPHASCDSGPCADFATFDADGDGFVTRFEAEVKEEEWDRALHLADADLNGKLSNAEFNVFMEYIENKASESNEELSAKLDEEIAGGDDTGVLDEALQGGSAGANFALLATRMAVELTMSHFPAFDRSADGFVDRDEALLHGSDEDWENTLHKFDTDNDRALSRVEFEKLLLDRRGVMMESSLKNVSHSMDAMHGHCQQDSGAVVQMITGAAETAHTARQQHIQALSLKTGLGWGSETNMMRTEALRRLFNGADSDHNGVLTMREYADAGAHARFEQVQGPFREAMDLDGDGQLFDHEASVGSAFEFHMLDGDQDGAVGWQEMKDMFASKGWLGVQKFRHALALATEQTLPGLVAALLELSWGEDSTDKPHLELEHGRATASEGAAAAASHWNTSLLALGSPATRRRATRRPKLSTENAQALASIVGNTAVASMSDILSQEFCWRKSYDRGVGQPAGCSSKYEARGAMCYPRCGRDRSRSNGDIEFCNRPCPSGTTDTGLHCRTNGHTKSKSCCGTCWPNNWCCRTWCCGGCPSGYTNTGCFCEPSWVEKDRQYSPGKTKYDAAAVGCADPRYPDGPKQTPLGYFCYPRPRPGYSCDLTACRENCPTLLQPCGLGACAASGAGCGSTIFRMAFDTAMAVVDTALLVGSFGTTSAGASQAKRVAVKKSTQSTFRSAAKANLRMFQRKLRSGATKRAVKKFVAEKLTKTAMKKVLKDALADQGTALVENAVGAVINEFLAKKDSDMENFDYTSLDPTGISAAAKSSIDGESALSQARAWTEVVGTVDPTGWVAAAASFMHPTCQR